MREFHQRPPEIICCLYRVELMCTVRFYWFYMRGHHNDLVSRINIYFVLALVGGCNRAFHKFRTLKKNTPFELRLISTKTLYQHHAVMNMLSVNNFCSNVVHKGVHSTQPFRFSIKTNTMSLSVQWTELPPRHATNLEANSGNVHRGLQLLDACPITFLKRNSTRAMSAVQGLTMDSRTACFPVGRGWDVFFLVSLTHWPWEMWQSFYKYNLQTRHSNWGSRCEIDIRWIQQPYTTDPHLWKINIGSGDGLVPPCNKPFTWTNVDPDPCRHMASQGHNEF